jgi:hypothetical protein
MNDKSSSVRLDEAFAALGNAQRPGLKHMRQLEKARLIERRKAGRTNFVALDRQSLATAKTWLNQFYTEWGDNRETLENYISSLK